jgi:hypothetical protein
MVNSAPKNIFSIIVAVGPVHQWLAEMIASVSSQTLADTWQLEILIGVDGYQDSLESARKLDDPRIKLYMAKQPVGTYVMANSLLALSTGIIVARADADDLMCQGRLMAIIQAMADPAVAMANTYSTRIDGRGARLKCKARKVSDGVWAFRKAVFVKQLGGWPAWPCGADSETLFRAKALNLKSKIVPRILYLVRQHDQQLTRCATTAHGSSLRKQYCDIIERDACRYARGVKPLRIEPVTVTLERQPTWRN